MLAKNLDVFYGKYDFTESIVTNIGWDPNLLDLLVILDYYWDDLCGQKLVIRFKNCQKSEINMPKCSADFSESEMKAYINSWYTITKCTIENTDDLFTVRIKTIDDEPQWLSVVYREIWLEKENLDY